MGFKFHHGGKTWEMDALIGDEIIALEDQLGIRYIELQPGARARDTLAILATFLARDKSEEQVGKAIKRLTYKEILNDIWSYDVESSMPTEFDGDGGDLPKVTAPTSGTGTSSSSRRSRTAGPRQSPGASPSTT